MAYKLAVFEILGDFFVLAYKLCVLHIESTDSMVHPGYRCASLIPRL